MALVLMDVAAASSLRASHSAAPALRVSRQQLQAALDAERRQAMSYSISTLLTRNLHDVFGVLHPEVREFGDMAEAILAGQNFNEGAEFFDGDHLATVDSANLRFGRHAGDAGGSGHGAQQQRRSRPGAQT